MRFSVRAMAFTAVFAAILCVAAPFSIFIGPVPLSLATLAIYLAAGALDWKSGAASVVLYVLLGMVGLPVFSGFEGGFHKIAGVTGGFIIGYIACALGTGLVIELFRRKFWAYALGMVIGTVLLYTCGTAWFIFQTGLKFPASLTLCVTPFLPGDIAKIIVACIAAPRLRKALSGFSRK